MSKYTFEKLGADRFEHLVQALLEKLYRTGGSLTQFGVGPDGAREATWSQPPAHESYARPQNESSDANKEWVFQAKFHDIGQRGWAQARADVEADLGNELDKIVNKYQVPCHKYVLITNVPFSGVRHVGTRDKVNAVIRTWQSKVPEIEVWDATDLSRMLDADIDTRTRFLGEILPGDVLRELLKNLTRSDETRVNSFRTYLKSLLRSEREARAEEAGDESGLKLEKVFVDLDLSLNQDSANDCAMPFVRQVLDQSDRYPDYDHTHIPRTLECIPASFALLRANYKSLLLKGGPGVGKSTLTQFLSLYHAARLVDPPLARRLAERLKLSGGVTPESLDSHCQVRFPLRIELRRYAKWVGEKQSKQENPHFAVYFAEHINKESSSSFDMEDVFALTSKNPVLLLLDGLDEVPQPSTREIIFRELQIFLDRCESEECNVNVILSSRPQGYRGEFSGFDPLEWQVVDLSRRDFNEYSDRWLVERIASGDERADAQQRITDGMNSYAVQLMAKTLLQATVMLTIAKRKHAIPHAKHKLYEKFVEVTFEREQNKQPIIRRKANELKRLHEKVGFELICKLERQDGDQTLESAEFRNCVERVILDYGCGPSDFSNLRSVVDEIVTLAKDRLCLLAGKGEDQQDIDFVIQPFREYFAAAYLARHEDADPDRVYQALSSRQHIWANVLQFYAAFQSTAQQRNWISEADGSDQSGSDVDDLIEMTRRRRGLIRVIPEFERPRNEYVRRAFKNLLETSTRWTWRDRNSTAELLDAFSQNQAFSHLQNCFGDLSVNEDQNLFVELDLLCKADRSEDKSKVRTLLSELAKQEKTRSTALQVAHQNELAVNVDSIAVTDLASQLTLRYVGRPGRPGRYQEFRLENWKGLSDGKVIDLAVSRSFNRNAFKKAWINDLFSMLSGNRVVFELCDLGILFPTYCFERATSNSIEFIRQKLNSLEDCLSSHYLAALLDAIQNPTDSEIYSVADNEASSLNKKLHLLPNFHVRRQLGPAPSAFESSEKWMEARNAVFPVDSRELSDWVKELSGYLWTILFVPESGWKSVEQLADEDQLQQLKGNVLERLNLMSASAPINAEIIRYSEPNDVSERVLEALVNVAQVAGPSFLDDNDLVRVFSHADYSSSEQFDGNAFLEKVESMTLPSTFCVGVLNLLIADGAVDLGRLVVFWKSHCQSMFLWIGDGANKLLGDLLAVDTADSICMAASVRNTFHHTLSSLEISTNVAKKYCGHLIRSPVVSAVDLNRLFGLPAQAEEIELWQRDDAIQALQESEWGRDAISERFFDIINSTKEKHDLTRKVLCKILQTKNSYRVEVKLAAVDAIHRLDELMRTPLTDFDWQTHSD